MVGVQTTVFSTKPCVLRDFLHAAHHRIAVLNGPTFQRVDVFIIQVKRRAATWAGDNVDAIAPGFAPAQH